MVERPVIILIVGHADAIEEDCLDRLAQAWRLEGAEVVVRGVSRNTHEPFSA
jgi:hypothetical protein